MSWSISYTCVHRRYTLHISIETCEPWTNMATKAKRQGWYQIAKRLVFKTLGEGNTLSMLCDLKPRTFALSHQRFSVLTHPPHCRTLLNIAFTSSSDKFRHNIPANSRLWKSESKGREWERDVSINQCSLLSPAQGSQPKLGLWDIKLVRRDKNSPRRSLKMSQGGVYVCMGVINPLSTRLENWYSSHALRCSASVTSGHPSDPNHAVCVCVCADGKLTYLKDSIVCR